MNYPANKRMVPFRKNRGGERLDPFAARRLNRVILLAASFLLSWQLFRIPEGNFTASDILFSISFIVLAVSGQLKGDLLGRMTFFWIGGLVLMLGGLLASSLFSGGIDRWLLVAGQYMFALFVVLMVLRSCDRDLLQSAALAFAFGVALSQGISLLAIQFLTYDEMVPWVGRTVLAGNGRVGAITGEPNSNGAVCVFALLILIHAVLGRKLSWPVALGTAALLVAGLIASASFTGFVAALLAVSIMLLVARPLVLFKFGLPVVALSCLYIAVGGPVPKPFQQRVVQAIKTGDIEKAGTFDGRLTLVSEAWNEADDNLIIGLGADRFREVSAEGAPVHNLHLLILNEGGLIASVGLTMLLGSLAATALMRLHRNAIDGAACLAALGVLLLYTFAIPHMYARNWSGPPLIVFALALAGGGGVVRRRPFYGTPRVARPSPATGKPG
jgi:O-antigen ligase